MRRSLALALAVAALTVFFVLVPPSGPAQAQWLTPSAVNGQGVSRKPLTAPSFTATAPTGTPAFSSASGARWRLNAPADGTYVSLWSGVGDRRVRASSSTNDPGFRLDGQAGVYIDLNLGLVDTTLHTEASGNVFEVLTNATTGSASMTLIGASTTNIGIASCDSTATPGAATCNQASGQAAIAANATAVPITNSTVSPTSRVLVTLRTIDATCLYVRAAQPGAGSFTVTVGPSACTAPVGVSWLVIN